MGSERTDNIRPKNMLQLEASSEWGSPQENSTTTNVPNIVEVDLTADSTSESPEVSLVANKEKNTVKMSSSKPRIERIIICLIFQNFLTSIL